MARTFGRWNVDRFLAEIPERQFREWMREYAIGPWGEERGDLRSGLICSLIDACHRTKGQPKPPIDYMPYVKGPSKPMSVADMKATWGQIAKHWGKSKRKGKGETGGKGK